MTRGEKVFQHITCYSPLTHLGHIDKEWIVECINEAIKEAFADGTKNTTQFTTPEKYIEIKP